MKEKQKQKIFVTGMGIISALGIGEEEHRHALRQQRSGIREMRYLRSSLSLPVGEVDYSNEELSALTGAEAPVSELRTALLGIVAAREAVKNAGLNKDNFRQSAFVCGTTVGGMDLTEKHFGDVEQSEAECDATALLKYNDCGYVSEMIADSVGNFGMVTTVSTACSSAANAIIFGAELIRSGRAEIVVAGGAEALSRFHLNGFNTLMILDKERCRPFGADRSGINLGEGAGFLVLESEESARRRGINPEAELSGWGNACDAFHQTATSPEGEGPFLAMKKALDSAGFSPEMVDYINAHGTGTPDNDHAELMAMKRIWGEKIPPFSSTKVFTGHTTSAAGGLESIFSILALGWEFIPGQFPINFQEGSRSPETEVKEDEDVRRVLCNSFGFGGNDTSLIFSLT